MILAAEETAGAHPAKDNHTNTVLLYEKMERCQYTVPHVAARAGIAYSTLQRKLNGTGQFCVAEIVALSSVLELSGKDVYDIFFCPYLEKRAANSGG